MAQPVIPEVAGAVQTPTAIIVNVPSAAAEEGKQQDDSQQWYFQRFSDQLQEYENRMATIVNNSRMWLSLTYSFLFAIAITRIVLYFYLAKAYTESLITSDRTMIIIEACLSIIWLGYSINQFVSKLKLTYIENVRWTSLMYVLFCVQYFSVSYWVIETIFGYMPLVYGIVSVVLFVIYGFLAEKSPNTLAVTVYIILMFFLIECMVRLVMCKCYNPWKAPDTQQFVRKEIPIHLYLDTKYTQKSCGICLKDFSKDEKICCLSCHATHIFHSECLKEWLNHNFYCPFCRATISPAAAAN